MAQTVGIVGLGHIGGGIAMRLADVGALGAVYDVRTDAVDALEGVPALAASPAEVARTSDIVIVAVVSAAQTIAVLEGAGGILAAARPGLTIVLVATVSLDDLAAIRALTDAAGVSLVDCGVTGGHDVRGKSLACLVGATDAQLAAVAPALELFARSVNHMGGPGAGMAAKIARNLIYYGGLRAGAEGAALARAAGVDVARLAHLFVEAAGLDGGPLAMMARPSDSPEVAERREAMRALMVKDLDAALALGEALGLDLPLARMTRDDDRAVVGLDG